MQVWLVITQAGVLYGIVVTIGVREWRRRRRDTRQPVAVAAVEPSQVNPGIVHQG